MRQEKKYLVEEAKGYLGKSNYVFLANFERVTVAETAALRDSLSKQNAEFHVVKNSIYKIASKERDMPDCGTLGGPTAIITGGDQPSEIAKILMDFHKKGDKGEVKVAIMDDCVMTREEVKSLSTLPTLPVLRAQLLSLLNTPSQRMVTVIEAVPKTLLNVLQAKVRKEEN